MAGLVSFYPVGFASLTTSSSLHKTKLPSPSLQSIFPTITQTRVLRPSPSFRDRKTLTVSASIFPFSKKKDKQAVKEELLEAIAPLDRGADATPDDIARVDKIAQSLEILSPVRNTVTSPLINGKWELIYTTSVSILKKRRPKLLRPGGPIYQAINNDSLRAQNIETWPFFSQVTANLTPLNGRKVAVKFDIFKIAGLISIKAPETARGELEITYLDEELRISRGDKGNLFVLRMVDPTYRVPT